MSKPFQILALLLLTFILCVESVQLLESRHRAEALTRAMKATAEAELRAALLTFDGKQQNCPPLEKQAPSTWQGALEAAQTAVSHLEQTVGPGDPNVRALQSRIQEASSLAEYQFKACQESVAALAARQRAQHISAEKAKTIERNIAAAKAALDKAEFLWDPATRMCWLKEGTADTEYHRNLGSARRALEGQNILDSDAYPLQLKFAEVERDFRRRADECVALAQGKFSRQEP